MKWKMHVWVPLEKWHLKGMKDTGHTPKATENINITSPNYKRKCSLKMCTYIIRQWLNRQMTSQLLNEQESKHPSIVQKIVIEHTHTSSWSSLGFFHWQVRQLCTVSPDQGMGCVVCVKSQSYPKIDNNELWAWTEVNRWWLQVHPWSGLGE